MGSVVSIITDFVDWATGETERRKLEDCMFLMDQFLRPPDEYKENNDIR